MIVYYTIILFYTIDIQIFIYYDIKQSLTTYSLRKHRGLRLYS